MSDPIVIWAADMAGLWKFIAPPAVNYLNMASVKRALSAFYVNPYQIAVSCIFTPPIKEYKT